MNYIEENKVKKRKTVISRKLPVISSTVLVRFNQTRTFLKMFLIRLRFRSYIMSVI